MSRLPKFFTFANVASALALLVALSLTPAGAHVTSSFSHLWGDHIKPKARSSGDDQPVEQSRALDEVEGRSGRLQ